MGRICLQNPFFQGFEPIHFASLQNDDLLLQIGFQGHHRVFEFFELGNVNCPLGECLVDPVNLGFKQRQFSLEAVDLLLLFNGGFRLPCLDLGQKLFFPFIGDDDEFRVPLDLRRQLFLADEGCGRAVTGPAQEKRPVQICPHWPPSQKR